MDFEPSTAVAMIPASALPTIIAADSDDILGKLSAKVAAHKADISTKSGRDAIRSLAAEIAADKMKLIRLGKSLTEGWRESTKAVNEECKVIEARMDELKDTVRAPLTEFEDREKNRVAGHESALAEMDAASNVETTASSAEIRAILEAFKARPQRDWQEFTDRAQTEHAACIKHIEDCLDSHIRAEAEAAELARLREEAEERARQEAARQKAEHEAQIAAHAAAKAKAEADARAAEEAAQAARKAREAQEAIERQAREADERAAKAERDRIAAAAQAKADAEAFAAKVEADRIAAEAKAEKDRAAAVAAEQKRAADARAAQEAEAVRRAENVKHRTKINREALAALVALGVTEEQGRAVVSAIAKGEIPHVGIAY